jgi:hypothetical protein
MTKRTIQIKDLAAEENYAIQIRATGTSEEVQNSDWSLTLQFTTDKDVTAPDTVQGVSIVADGPDFVASWSEVALNSDLSSLKDLKNYRVRFFKSDNPTNFKDYVTENLSQRITFNEVRQELSSAPNISAVVFARDLGLNESVTSETDSVTNVAPSAFAAPVAANENDGQSIKVVFDQPTGVASDGSDNADDLSYYEIYKSPSVGVNSVVATIAFQAGQVSFVDPDPGPDTWTYYVKAYDLYGSSVTSLESNEVTPIYPFNDTTAPDPVSNLVLSGEAVVNSVSGDEAYIDASFTGTVTNDDGTNTDYLDNEGFSVRYRVNGSGSSFEFITVPDLRTGDPLPADTITVRIEGLKTDETYQVGVTAFDSSGNYSSEVSGTELTPTDATAPGQPSAVSAANDVQSVLVTHDLTLQAGGDLPDDTRELVIYASQTSGFTSSSANYLGTMQVVPKFADAVQKFPLPSSEVTPDGADAALWYVRVRAVDSAGNVSPESPQAAAAPNLISGAYIDNATINDAKINTLSANKLVADSAFVNRLSVESELEVNTSGFIKSSGWDGNDDGSGSTIGWWLGDDGLVINDGTIKAAALNIVEANSNLARYEFAAFSNTTDFYANTLYLDNVVSNGVSAVWSRYAGRSLDLTSTAGGVGTVYFSLQSSTVDYNVVVESSTNYIASCYIYHEFGSAVDIRVKVREDDNSETNPASGAVPSGVVTRISYAFTTNGTTEAILPGLLIQDAGSDVSFYVDGFQIEQASAGVVDPSFYKTPGYTSIEGNSITTGEIASSNFSAGALGWEVDFDGTAEFNEVTVRGAIYASSGEIGNLEITGLLTATGASGRLEADTNGLRLYDESVGGNVTVELDASTGKAKFAGAVTIVEDAVDQNINFAPSADWTGSNTLTQSSPGSRHIDGTRTGTDYASVGNAPGTPGSSAEDVYFEMDFGAVNDISELRTYWYEPNNRSHFYKIKYSRDGVNWFYAIGDSSTSGWAESTQVSSDVPNGTEVPTVNLFSPRISAKYIQIHGGGNTVNSGNDVYEIEAYATRTPKPALSVGKKFMVDEGGNLFASEGTFSGDIVGATTIKIGSGAAVFKADTNGIYLGDEVFGNAEFRVALDGTMNATNGFFTGSISATSGSIDGILTIEDGGRLDLIGGSATYKATFGDNAYSSDYFGLDMEDDKYGAYNVWLRQVSQDRTFFNVGDFSNGIGFDSNATEELTIRGNLYSTADIIGGTFKTATTGDRIEIGANFIEWHGGDPIRNGKISFVDNDLVIDAYSGLAGNVEIKGDNAQMSGMLGYATLYGLEGTWIQGGPISGFSNTTLNVGFGMAITGGLTVSTTVSAQGYIYSANYIHSGSYLKAETYLNVGTSIYAGGSITSSSTIYASSWIISGTYVQTGSSGLYLQGSNERIQRSGSNMYFYTGGYGRCYAGSNGFFPNGSQSELGGSGRGWRWVYAGGFYNSSDDRVKNEITDSDLGLDFINSLRPIRYKMKTGVRPHYGFSAQEVKTTIDAIGVDFAGYVDPTVVPPSQEESPDLYDEDGTMKDSNSMLALSYIEFVAPMAKAIQELTQRLEALEA